MLSIAAVLALLTLSGWPMRSPVVASVGTFCFVSVALALAKLPSQLFLLMALIAYWVVFQLCSGRKKPGWLKIGSLTRETYWWTATSVLASAIAMSLWLLLLRPDIADLSARYLPDWPLPALIVGGLTFSMLNAAVEEASYRGVVANALELAGSANLALFGQAVAFGFLHIHGFPRGWVGVGLACVFGLLMAVVRRKSGGLFAPWAAHVCADMVIVALVVGYTNA